MSETKKLPLLSKQIIVVFTANDVGKTGMADLYGRGADGNYLHIKIELRIMSRFFLQAIWSDGIVKEKRE